MTVRLDSELPEVHEVLFVLDNTPGHLQDICFDHPYIKFKHLSSTRTSLLYLLNKGFILTIENWHCAASNILTRIAVLMSVKFSAFMLLSALRRALISFQCPGNQVLTLVEMPHLTSSASKKGLQMGVRLGDQFLVVNHFINKCLKCMHELEGIMSPCKEVYKNMQKTKQSKNTSFCSKTFALASGMCSLSFDHPNHFQPGTSSPSFH